jgi:hypothetical protein
LSLDVQVLTLIDKAVADVQAWLGPTPPPELAEAAKVAAAGVASAMASPGTHRGA